MPIPYRCSVTIDGTKFGAISSSVQFSTEKDHSGCPQMGSLSTTIRVWANFHDNKNLPFSAMKKMFDLANVVTENKIKPIKIEFLKDDSRQDALCSYSFNGWIKRFETTNPIDLPGLEEDLQEQFRTLTPGLNHVLVLDLEPAMNQKNFTEIRMGK